MGRGVRGWIWVSRKLPPFNAEKHRLRRPWDPVPIQALPPTCCVTLAEPYAALIFYSHTDKMRLTTNPHLGWLMEGVKGQRCHRAHSRCGTQQGFMPREHAQVHGDHGCAGRRTQVPGTSGAGAQSIACEDQRDPVRVPSLGSCGPQGANCVSAFLAVTGEPKTTLKGRACHTASALGVR